MGSKPASCDGIQEKHSQWLPRVCPITPLSTPEGKPEQGKNHTFQGTKIVFLFPACEVKVVRFYVSWPLLLLLLLAEPQLQACDRGDPSRTRTASSGSEWSLPAGPEHQAVAPAGPEQQRRTQTASSGSASRRSEWSLLDLNCKREIPVVPAGPNTKIECQIECQNRCQIGCQDRCQIESQKEWQIERENICHNIYIYT